MQKANTPEPIQNYRLALGIGSKGYIALAGGVWEYDPGADTWVRKLPLPAGVTSFSTGFSIGGKGYFGWAGGKTLWEFDPLTDSWVQKADFPESSTGQAFSIGNKGYVIKGGQDPLNIYDLWEYNPGADSWIQKASFGGSKVIGPNTFNMNAISLNGFEVDGNGYVATMFGVTPYQFSGYLWQYDPLADKWTRRGLGFGTGNKGYLGFGFFSFRSGAPIAHDLWEYTPAPAPVPPVNGTGLQGVYYKGSSLTNYPLLTRIDTVINFELTYSGIPQVLSPAPGLVPEDRYSVIWSGQVVPQYSETYTFYTVADDGIRLWVNSVQLVDNWGDQDATENSGGIVLQAGQHYDIRIEYYENTGNAVTQLLWSSAATPKAIVPRSQLYPPPEGGTGLMGQYFSGTALSGAALLSRVDPSINFELTYSAIPQVLSPAHGIVPEDAYSVRWTGKVKPLHTETYTFYTLADDGVRLWVNGVQLVNNWTNQDAAENSGSIALEADQQYDIVMEYYENTGNAVAKLLWSSESTPKSIIPQAQLFPLTNAANARQISGAATTSPAFNTIAATIRPNPVAAGKELRLSFVSEKSAAVFFNITGSNGRLVSTRRINLVQGENIINVNTGGFTPGIYIINITGAGQMHNYKMVVQ